MNKEEGKRILWEQVFPRRDRIADIVFSLSTGAIALSVTFRSFLVGDGAIAAWLLIPAWLSLFTSVVLYLFQLGRMAKICHVISDILCGGESSAEDLTKADVACSQTRGMMTLMFLVGVSLLILFASLNVLSHQPSTAADRRPCICHGCPTAPSEASSRTHRDTGSDSEQPQAAE